MVAILQMMPMIAAGALEADKRGLVRSATWLFVGLIAIGAVGIGMVWVAASAARRKARARRERAKKLVIPDAWAEAGRRMEPLPTEDDEREDDGETWRGGPE